MSLHGISSAGPSSRRYLSLWLPYLTADRWQREHATRSQEQHANRCLVFIERSTGASRISAGCAQAHTAGLTAGMALADARARVPDLKAIAHDPVPDHAFLDDLADAATAFTPSVARHDPDGLVLDITGCVRLFGSEAALAARLRRILSAKGISRCRLAIATTPDMARALARFGPSDAINADDKRDVRALPIAALECSAEDTNALRRAGLKTIGDVADRPSVLFSARFDRGFATRVARILGEEDRRIAPRRPPAPLVFDHNCAEPLISSDAIEVVMADLIARACAELEARREGGRVFHAVFFRTDGVIRRIVVETSRPLRDAKMILRLYRDRLDALADPLDPGFGFDLIRFEIVHTQVSAARQTSLDAAAAQDDQAAALCDRLTAMFGRTRVLCLALQDTHDPDRAQVLRPACDERSPATLSASDAARALTLFAPPHPIEAVALVSPKESDTPPRRFRWRRKVHEVTRSDGPERIAPEWWRPPGSFGTRDYFRVETADGQRFWLFRAHVTSQTAQSRWFLHGVFP